MTIQDLGAIGELLGGVAVIASVLYLAIQIRHGLRGYQSNITQQITNQFSSLQANIAADEGLSIIWTKAQRGEALNDLEQGRMIQLVSAYMIGFENMYFQYQSGMLVEEAYTSRRGIIPLLFQIHGITGWWERFGRHQHPADFVSEVDNILTTLEHEHGN